MKTEICCFSLKESWDCLAAYTRKISHKCFTRLFDFADATLLASILVRKNIGVIVIYRVWMMSAFWKYYNYILRRLLICDLPAVSLILISYRSSRSYHQQLTNANGISLQLRSHFTLITNTCKCKYHSTVSKPRITMDKSISRNLEQQ